MMTGESERSTTPCAGVGIPIGELEYDRGIAELGAGNACGTRGGEDIDIICIGAAGVITLLPVTAYLLAAGDENADPPGGANAIDGFLSRGEGSSTGM